MVSKIWLPQTSQIAVSIPYRLTGLFSVLAAIYCYTPRLIFVSITTLAHSFRINIQRGSRHFDFNNPQR